ncbi:MAG: hypothetical protein WDO19_22340 [Bacteroidota bacterium]
MKLLVKMKNRIPSFLILLIAHGFMVNMANAQDTVLNVPYNRKLDSLNSAY